MLFRILGPVQIEASDGRVIVLKRRRERCLLALLALEPNRVMPADRLYDLLWDGDPPAGARHAVHNHVAAIRAALANAMAPDDSAALVSHGGGYELRTDPAGVDAHRMRALVDEARRISDPNARHETLARAVALWRGTPLHNAVSEQLRERLCPELDELYLTAVEDMMAAGLELGRHGTLVASLAQLTAAHPERERLLALHLLALYRAGRTPEALSLYQRFRDHLAADLGLDPGPELVLLHQRILRQDPALALGAQPARTAPGPRQLPPRAEPFVGRKDLLARLDALATPHAADTVGITIVTGAGGLGKTALAVHWGRLAADRFPDGQLFVDLRGYSTLAPLRPYDAVALFLRALDVPDDKVPPDLPEAVTLYRTCTADRRLLVVIDNAHHPDQVRPLLPAGAGSHALVTSRDALPGLVARDGAKPVHLDVLPAAEAIHLLALIIDDQRVPAEPEALAALAHACAYLPLALRIAAAQLAIDRRRTIAAHLAELRADRLSPLSIDNDAEASLRASFHLSYRALTQPARRVLALLGLHPGPDVSAATVASLAAMDESAVAVPLRELVDAHLVIERADGRFTFHDLLRAYALEKADELPDGTRAAATRRLYDHCVHTAYAGAVVLDPSRDPFDLVPPAAGALVGQFADHGEALAYFTAEHSASVALISHARDISQELSACHLARLINTYLERRGHWQDLMSTQTDALWAAEKLGDVSTQARTRRVIALAHAQMGHYDEAYAEMTAALDMYAEISGDVGEAHVHYNIVRIAYWQKRYELALHHAQRAGELYAEFGNRAGEANTLNAIAWIQVHLGRYQESIGNCERALALLRELGDLNGQAGTWDTTALAQFHLGFHQEAIAGYRTAVELYRRIGDRYNEADVLSRLGDAEQRAGLPDAARETWQRALTILEEMGHPDAGKIRERLGST